MNSAFNISTPGADTTQCNLLIEVSCYGISYTAIDNDNNCVALVIYHFVAGTTNDQAANYLKNIVADQTFLQQPFKKIAIIYAFSNAILVPHEFMNAHANKEMLELVYSDTSESITRTDFMYRHNLHTAYMVPKQIDSMLAHLFPHANYSHQYALLPDVVEATGNLLYCIFNTTHITVQLFKLGKLQMIQNFSFKVPEDAGYHLLNVCERFEVAVTDTLVYLNGMVDADSSLYNMLHTYFLHLEFADLPKQFIYNEEIKKYPEHYFSHLFQLAACV